MDLATIDGLLRAMDLTKIWSILNVTRYHILNIVNLEWANQSLRPLT